MKRPIGITRVVSTFTAVAITLSASWVFGAMSSPAAAGGVSQSAVAASSVRPVMYDFTSN